MQSMKQAFDLDKLQAMINRAKQSAGSLEGSTQETTSYRCQTCRDEGGIIVRNEENEEVWRTCSCVESTKIERAFKSSRITPEFQKKSFENFNPLGRPPVVQGAYECARTFLHSFERIRHERQNSIALLGKPGCGKTHLLISVANGLLSRGIQVLYFPWVEGFNEIKDDLSLCEERIGRMQKVDVLFIDDMWKGRPKQGPTDFQIEQMFSVINDRYLNKRPILVSSEKDIDDMCAIDEAIGSRINEMCKDFRVVLHGGKELNYRLREESA